MTSHAERVDGLAQTLRQRCHVRAPVALAKATSNLFRDRLRRDTRALDVHEFDHVLDVDPDAGWIDVEGMAPYERVTDAALSRGVMPAVVPQLKTITVGGAAAGVGIEATSFRQGLVHETLRELDILTADATVVTARPGNEHEDLFYGFANSYGTLGYALRVRARTIPVKRYVRLERTRRTTAESFFEALAQACAGDADFVDGVVFAPDELIVNTARFVDHAPYTSDYTFEHIYYRSVRERPEDFLTTHDYLWRWDTDWFWCSKNVGAQIPWIRRLYGRGRLGSRTYTKIMRWNSRIGLSRAVDRLRGMSFESVIQDVDIPIEHAATFLAFLISEIGILPVWICPICPTLTAKRFVLYPLTPQALYVNFGFWDTVRTREPLPPGHFNRLVEREVARLGGIKSLYSESYYSREEFWALYDKRAYDALKARYDPDGVFGDLYDKCVLRH